MATITSLVARISIPFILLFSLPLAVFAVFTSILAFWILLFRVLLFYAEAIPVILQAALLPWTLSKPAVEPPVVQAAPKPEQQSARPRRNSPSQQDSTRAKEHKKSESFNGLSTTLENRDFEGVGGWRLAGDDEEEALWMGLNSHLSSPSAPLRRHKPAFTIGGSAFSSGVVSPELVRSPLRIRTPGGAKTVLQQQQSGNTSPVEYFPSGQACGNLAGLGSAEKSASRVSFGEMRRSRNSSSASLGSVPALTRHEFS